MEKQKQGCGKEGISGEGEYLICGEGIFCDECSRKKIIKNE